MQYSEHRVEEKEEEEKRKGTKKKGKKKGREWARVVPTFRRSIFQFERCTNKLFHYNTREDGLGEIVTK